MNARDTDVRQQLLHRRETLLTLRRLHGLAAQLVQDLGGPEGKDRAEVPEELQMLARLHALEERALEEVERALERLGPEGTARCEVCGSPLEPERPRSLPEARCCMARA
ncbi:hypothetical protein [Corallococcus llansteffanensis]|uniref:hypothetical protein n=1 Tax=Corallococcus llansteffanensis TaxID=2316731 RepID=UPI00131592CE|nr:hypothetical protein [Corallococcus llansteffanensis]